MQIRCEKCPEVYELDEKLVPPGGAPVQCSKCQTVFRVYPPSERPVASAHGLVSGASGDEAGAHAAGAATAAGASGAPPEGDGRATSEDAGAQGPVSGSRRPAEALPPIIPPAGSRAEGASRGPGTAASGSVPGPKPQPAGGGGGAVQPGQLFTSDGRPIRKVSFPEGELRVASRPTAPRVPSPGSTPPRQLAPLMRWAVLVAVIVALALAAIGWRLLKGTGEPNTNRRPDRHGMLRKVPVDRSAGEPERKLPPAALS